MDDYTLESNSDRPWQQSLNLIAISRTCTRIELQDFLNFTENSLPDRNKFIKIVDC